MPLTWSRVAGLALLAAAVGGCHPSWFAAKSPGQAACADPCVANNCPTGTRCVWNDACQASCAAESPPSGWKP